MTSGDSGTPPRGDNSEMQFGEWLTDPVEGPPPIASPSPSPGSTNSQVPAQAPVNSQAPPQSPVESQAYPQGPQTQWGADASVRSGRFVPVMRRAIPCVVVLLVLSAIALYPIRLDLRNTSSLSVKKAQHFVEQQRLEIYERRPGLFMPVPVMPVYRPPMPMGGMYEDAMPMEGGYGPPTSPGITFDASPAKAIADIKKSLAEYEELTLPTSYILRRFAVMGVLGALGVLAFACWIVTGRSNALTLERAVVESSQEPVPPGWAPEAPPLTRPHWAMRCIWGASCARESLLTWGALGILVWWYAALAVVVGAPLSAVLLLRAHGVDSALQATRFALIVDWVGMVVLGGTAGLILLISWQQGEKRAGRSDRWYPHAAEESGAVSLGQAVVLPAGVAGVANPGAPGSGVQPEPLGTVQDNPAPQPIGADPRIS